VLPVLVELLRDASLWLATLLLGDAVHTRRALSRAYWLFEVERAVGRVAAQHAARADCRAAEATGGVIADAFGEVTVGDAYMVAGGLPDPRPDHAGAAAEVALEMRSVADRRSLPDGGPVRLRIWIASGPVVAGVIGRAVSMPSLRWLAARR